MKHCDSSRRSLLSLPVLALAVAGARAAAASADAGDAASGRAVPPSFEAGTFAKIVSAGAGRPLVVHFWGLTCAPCIEELPRWGTFVRREPGLNVAFIQVDPMPPDRVAAILRRAGLERARNWTARAPVDERWRYRIDPDWAGELPRTLLIAATGRRIASSGRVDFEHLRSWLGRDR
ncbi:MAG TPA: TlpA disulfide reductase family protein [Burkholderiaceae bacterium]|jgi:thiol-disulfide isomerase/thioredoxin|nr:TlpA disulfide reductase family protein [Burkholderiaceae bacterium]